MLRDAHERRISRGRVRRYLGRQPDERSNIRLHDGKVIVWEGHAMKKILLAAALVLGGYGSAAALPAPAASAPSIGAPAQAQTLQLVKMKRHHRHHHWRRHHHWNRPHFNRYERYRGWRRYHARPYNWHRRGCVMVGPLWFCP